MVSSFNLSQSLNYTPYLFYKKRFDSEINFFSIDPEREMYLQFTHELSRRICECDILQFEG
jgi:hypothetical protein